MRFVNSAIEGHEGTALVMLIHGIAASELVEQTSWWQGPTFLRECSSCWPNLEPPNFNQEAKTEMVKSISSITHLLVATSSQFIHQSIEEVLITVISITF